MKTLSYLFCVLFFVVKSHAFYSGIEDVHTIGIQAAEMQAAHDIKMRAWMDDERRRFSDPIYYNSLETAFNYLLDSRPSTFQSTAATTHLLDNLRQSMIAANSNFPNTLSNTPFLPPPEPTPAYLQKARANYEKFVIDRINRKMGSN